MRQIGVRDEAKLLADYGDCGKPVCCNTHLIEMPPVSMKMAKLQKATLDPTQDLRPLRPAEVLPALRVRHLRGHCSATCRPSAPMIITSTGRARVLAQEILAGQVLVPMEDRAASSRWSPMDQVKRDEGIPHQHIDAGQRRITD